MPWTVDNPPPPAKNWPKADREKCVRAANGALRNGRSEQQAIFACIRAAGRSSRKALSLRGPLRPVPDAFDTTGTEWLKNPAHLPFKEAIHAARQRGVVLPDTYYGKLQGAARSHAFSIAGISQLGQIQQALDSLTSEMEAGGTFAQWKDKVRKGEVDLALPDYRLENIWRTNLQGHYARGRCEHIDRNRERRPELLYNAINDSRTRPTHAAMDGHVAPVDADVWGAWMPPNGYQCRCTVISLSPEQAKRYSHADQQRRANNPKVEQARTQAMGAGPDQGWGYSVCEAPDKGMQDALDEAGVSLGEPFKKPLAQIKEEAHKARSADPTTWKRVGEAQGSNKGGLYEAPDGTRHYVKFYDDPEQGRIEVATNELNRQMGLDAPESRMVEMEDGTGVALKWRDDLQDLSAQDLQSEAMREEVAKAYQAAVLTKNWDVVGAEYDNLKRTPDGGLFAVDSGGSMTFRAQGGAKPYTAGPVEELESLLDPAKNRQAAEVFGAHGEQALKRKFTSRLRQLRKKNVEMAFSQAGLPLDRAKELAETTWQRRNWLITALKKKPTRTSDQAPDYFKESAQLTPTQAWEILNEQAKGTGMSKGVEKAKARGYGEEAHPFLAAIHSYTTNFAYTVNPDLRHGGAGKYKKFAKVATEGIRRLPKYQGWTRRGIRLDPGPLQRLRGSVEQALQQDKPLEFQGMFSAAQPGGGFGGNVEFIIDTRGVQGADVDWLSAHGGEKEVLFPHRSRFRVQRYEENSKGGIKVYLMEDPDYLGDGGVKFSFPRAVR